MQMEIKANNFIEEIINEDLAKGAVKEIYTRFPPEPNGCLHIGHAKAVCVNFGIKEKYGGKCNLRFDDTNPVAEDEEFVESIKRDIEWLGFKWDKLLFASDYFDIMYEKAVLLIKKGKAFVCDLSAEEISKTRGTLTTTGVESPYRNRSVEENIDLFTRMKNGEFKDGERVLRAKINMQSPNINMRDPVIYRILHTKHHNTGDKWCIYPMYDFAHPLEDAIEGITHSLCSLEFLDHRPLYNWFVNQCEFEQKPKQREFARLNLTNTVMSKRYLKRLVEEGCVDGWDDPRLPTLAGMRRRGYLPKVIRDFLERVGVSRADSVVEYGYLEALMRDELNVTAQRRMVVSSPVKVVLTNYEGAESVEIENNPNDEQSGSRTVSFSKTLYIDGSDFMLSPPPKYHRLSKGASVRLKGAYIITCDDVALDEHGAVDHLKCSYVADSKSGNDTSGLKVKGVIQWVNAADCEEIILRKFQPLLKDIDGETDFIKRVNPDSAKSVPALAERCLSGASDDERFQFMRIGYFAKDGKSGEERATFNEVVGLKDTFNK
jgi:glutaminyl-tRNA synthetase